VLSQKEDKELSLPENEESLQQLQNILTKIPGQLEDKDSHNEDDS